MLQTPGILARRSTAERGMTCARHVELHMCWAIWYANLNFCSSTVIYLQQQAATLANGYALLLLQLCRSSARHGRHHHRRRRRSRCRRCVIVVYALRRAL